MTILWDRIPFLSTTTMDRNGILSHGIAGPDRAIISWDRAEPAAPSFPPS
jgi:hypothetical protein